MKDNNKESIQQNDKGIEPNKGIKTPEPPQKKDPRNEATSEGGEGKNKSGKAADTGTDRNPAGNEQAGGNTGKQVPANNKEEQTKPPTTTTNR